MSGRTARRVGLMLLLLLCGSGSRSLRAQDTSTVAVEVTAVFEESVYLDKGWVHGVAEGDVVRIVVEPGETIAAKVRSVSSEDARCVPLEGIGDIQVGMAGEIDIHPPPETEMPVPDRESLPSEIAGDEIAQVDFEQIRTHPGAIERRQARVTATSGGSVYLNIGRDAGLRPGDEVTFFPPNDGIVNGTVQSLSATSARCTILSGQNNVDIGTRAEVLLPTDRLSLEQERAEPRPRSLPEHPPWTATPENWDENQPLLAAPAYARPASERDLQLHGRMFASYMHTLNQLDFQNQYSLGRVGTSMWMENPFRRGGGLHIDGELNRRGAFLDDQPDDLYGPGRLDRISYYWGGSETQPLRFEMGRFLSSEFPEFGVLDGTELVYRTASGNRIGASVGLLPQPFPNLGCDRRPARRYILSMGVRPRGNANECDRISEDLAPRNAGSRPADLVDRLQPESVRFHARDGLGRLLRLARQPEDDQCRSHAGNLSADLSYQPTTWLRGERLVDSLAAASPA